MTDKSTSQSLSANLMQAVTREGVKFQEYYLWLERTMPKIFFEEVDPDNLILITHNLMGLDLQDYFSCITRKNTAIALSLDTPQADLHILQYYSAYGIKNYQTYVSKERAPFSGVTQSLRITTIDFTEAVESHEKILSEDDKQTLWKLLRLQHPSVTEEEFEGLLAKMNSHFLQSLPQDRLALALNLWFRAQTRDYCQFEVRYDEDWQNTGGASMHLVLAWRNTPKHNFLYRLAQVVYRHDLSMKRVNATYTDSYHKQNILVMALSLHGSNGQAVWDVADIPDFLREVTTVKYFEEEDLICKTLIDTGYISGNQGNLLRAMVNFIHQALVNVDSHIYTIENVEEALCRHPELTLQLCEAFKLRFDPNYYNLEKFVEARKTFLSDVAQLDTGQGGNDIRRKNVLQQGMNFINHTLKTNFYRLNYTAMSFRLDPKYLDEIPFDRTRKFPELPYGIFYIRGMHFFGFHIRFKDLARGGLRTIYPQQVEQMSAERNHVFTECYNLALTQHKKNKDIPEGGAKGVIFLQLYSKIDAESSILQKELEWLKIDSDEIKKRLKTYREDQKLEYLYQSQRAFIESFVTIINCDENGKIRARFIVDYWKKAEYIYLGPDENMHDSMIDWIANFSKKYHYKPGGAFISSKPSLGINHKEYGVTSLGINVYMHETLKYLGIDPEKEPFTIKMTGGPDGDVAGNQLLNLYKFYRNTAKVVALTDGTGTIRDSRGLDLSIIKELFHQNKGINNYPPDKLSSGGFLVDKSINRFPSPYIQETLCWKKTDNDLIETWLSGSDTNHLLRTNVHQTYADIFIPAGGRPKTLNELNIKEFLDDSGKPSAKAIIEGANLYLNENGRRYLEERGVLIIKDSSANKCGVICSSFEVLCGLTLNEQAFLEHKEALVEEILDRLRQCAYNEAQLLFRTHQQTGEPLTAISDRISERINYYTYQLLDYLDLHPLSDKPDDPMISCFLDYCLPTLRDRYSAQLLQEIPEHHKKAIIACHLSAQIIYNRGLDWSPSLVDILPIILQSSTNLS